MSQKSNYLSALRQGQNKHTPVACSAFSPLALLSFSQVCDMTQAGKAALASSAQQHAAAMAGTVPSSMPVLSPLADRLQRPQHHSRSPAKSPQNLAAGLYDVKSQSPAAAFVGPVTLT